MDKDNEIPSNLGGLGGMLPAEVLEMLNELLEQLHQRDHSNQGGNVINIFMKGSQKTDLACFAEVWLTALGAVQIKRQIMKKQTLLINFFRKEYYDAYDEMMERLRPLLLTPQQNPRLVERLDFRPDLPRGSKKIIYTEIARLLQSGDFVLAHVKAKMIFSAGFLIVIIVTWD